MCTLLFVFRLVPEGLSSSHLDLVDPFPLPLCPQRPRDVRRWADGTCRGGSLHGPANRPGGYTQLVSPGTTLRLLPPYGHPPQARIHLTTSFPGSLLCPKPRAQRPVAYSGGGGGNYGGAFPQGSANAHQRDAPASSAARQARCDDGMALGARDAWTLGGKGGDLSHPLPRIDPVAPRAATPHARPPLSLLCSPPTCLLLTRISPLLPGGLSPCRRPRLGAPPSPEGGSTTTAAEEAGPRPVGVEPSPQGQCGARAGLGPPRQAAHRDPRPCPPR